MTGSNASGASRPASSKSASGVATSCRRRAPSTTSRHHCSRISARCGSDVDLARAGEFVVEGVQRQQRVPMLRRREQRGEEPVRVMPPHQRGDRLVHDGQDGTGAGIAAHCPGGGAERRVVQG